MQLPTTKDLRSLARDGDYSEFLQAALAARLSPEETETIWHDPQADVIDDTPAIECYQHDGGDRLCYSESVPADELATSDRMEAYIAIDAASTMEVRR